MPVAKDVYLLRLQLDTSVDGTSREFPSVVILEPELMETLRCVR